MGAYPKYFIKKYDSDRTIRMFSREKGLRSPSAVQGCTGDAGDATFPGRDHHYFTTIHVKRRPTVSFAYLLQHTFFVSDRSLVL